MNAKIIELIKSRLLEVHKERLVGIVLFGSEARGDTTEESDIDLLVLLQGPVDYGRDLELNIESLFDLSLELGRRISAKPVDADEYTTVNCPLYDNARREGVLV